MGSSVLLPVNGFSTASCKFGALSGGDECMFFYTAILNWQPIFLILILFNTSNIETWIIYWNGSYKYYKFVFKCTYYSIRASLVAQTVKRLSAMRETRVQSLGREDPLEKEMATHSSILAWRIPWTEEPGRLQSTGSQRVGHDWATSLSLSFFHYSIIAFLIFKILFGWSLTSKSALFFKNFLGTFWF